MKRCTTCKEEKALDNFYNQPLNKNGLSGKCKRCYSDKVKSYQSTSNKFKEYKEKIKNDPYFVQYHRDHTRKQKLKYPHRVKARNKVQTAIKNGTLVRKPCEVCGAEKTDAHHSDYNKPLDVMFLCRTHHKEWHSNNTPINVTT